MSRRERQLNGMLKVTPTGTLGGILVAVELHHVLVRNAVLLADFDRESG